jgi:WD40 repeat protein
MTLYSVVCIKSCCTWSARISAESASYMSDPVASFGYQRSVIRKMSISLLESQSLRTDSSPSYSSHVPSQAYVLSIVALPGCYAASASSPSNAIPVFDSHTLQLQQTFPGHECATTSLRATNWDLTGFSSAILVSSGKDGAVKTWDSRISAAALTR